MREHLLPVMLAAALAWPGAAGAIELAGVRVPDDASVAGKPLVLNGAGIRTRLLFKVYVASLYLPHKATALDDALAASPRRVRLDLLRNLSANQLVDALLDGLAANTPPEALAAIKPQVDEMVRIMRGFGDVKEGSVVTLDYADGVTRIGQDGNARGSIEGEPFNQALLRIWLGEHPVQGDLRKALLGG
jgi:long-chain acyl-CoA synthetase